LTIAGPFASPLTKRTLKYFLKHILVAVDLSETSLGAVDMAVAIARKNGAALTIVNAIEPVYRVDETDTAGLSHHDSAGDVLQALAGSIEHAYELTPQVVQERSPVIDLVVRTAVSSSADLIVIGTHGASGYRDGFAGSNCYGVMKYALCPVLSVPPRSRVTSFSKPLYPIRPVSGALARFNVLQPFLGRPSQTDVLGLSYRKMERETKVLEKIVSEVDRSSLAERASICTAWGRGESLSDDVLQYAQQQSSDLIVVTDVLDMTAKAGYIGPHAQKIINCSKIPVISIKGAAVPSYA